MKSDARVSPTRLLSVVLLLGAAIPIQAQARGVENSAKSALAAARAAGANPSLAKKSDSDCDGATTGDSGHDSAEAPAVATVAQRLPTTGGKANIGSAAMGDVASKMGGLDMGHSSAKGAVAGAVLHPDKAGSGAVKQLEAAAEKKALGGHAVAHTGCQKSGG